MAGSDSRNFQSGRNLDTVIIDLSVPQVQDRVETDLEKVENLLHVCSSGHRGVIDQLTGHLIAAGGKRLRPVLTSVCAGLGPSPDAEAVVKAATVVELSHLASLYHDDVMDSAPTRRGAPSAQHLWGNNRAILAGDVLFAEASSLVADLGPDSARHHAKAFERMCVGQLNESFGPEDGDDPVDFYIQVLADKTGALVAEAAYFGAIHAGSDERTARIVQDFGEKIGVAFQIADDVIDLGPSAEATGKTPGTDLREGVRTLPVLLLERQERAGTLDSEGAALLARLHSDLTSDAALDAVVSELREHSVVEETRGLAQHWSDEAVRALDPLPESPVKEALVAFAHLMVNRNA